MSTENDQLQSGGAVASTDGLYRGTWTSLALNAGGRLHIQQVMPGKAWYRATMEWSGEKPVSGKVSMSVIGALEYLEAALSEDCAAEMLRNGSV